MSLNERFVPITLLNEFFIDRNTALPMAGGTLEFFRDTSRGTSKKIFALSNTNGVYSYVELPNPVSLSSVGTVEDASGNNVAIYAFPYIEEPINKRLELDLYFIRARDSGGGEQWTREAVPSLTSNNDPVSEGGGAINQLSNPQFSNYFIEDAATTIAISAANTVVPIAPDWDLVASGTGNIILQRHPADGNEAVPTFPSYYLSINVGTGVTNPRLRQRLNKNSGLWSGRFLSGLFTARVNSDTDTVTMKYRDSAGVTNNVTIFSAPVGTNFEVFGGSAEIGNSSNTQSGDDAFVDIEIELPINRTLDITSLQVLVTDSELVGDVNSYDARPANREQAFMGDYYIPRLNDRAPDSIMVGWDFPLNPAQISGDIVTVSQNAASGQAGYKWDQTIMARAGSDFNIDRDDVDGSMQINPTGVNSAVYMMQYLEGDAINRVIDNALSVNINAYTTSSDQDVTVRVYLFRASTAALFPTLPAGIGTMSTTGVFTLTAPGISEITRSNLPTAKAVLPVFTNAGQLDVSKDLKFNGWEITSPSLAENTHKFIAVVTFAVPSTATGIRVGSISVVPGDIPVRPIPKTYNQVLRECEYYYESSYQRGQVPATAVPLTGLFRTQSQAAFSSGVLTGKLYYASTFDFEFQSIKRAKPSVAFLSPTSGAQNSVVFTAYANSSTVAVVNTTDVVFNTHWATSTNTKAIRLIPVPVSPLSVISLSAAFSSNVSFANVNFHYVSDARLGVIA